jgi:Rrf2 family iron-sulfur cluster assembly transcriptional regulator
MSELSTTTILALHALHFMMSRGQPVSAREIARSGAFPLEQVRRVLAELQKQELIRSRPGRGYLLARAPGEIPLSDVIQAIGERRPPTAPCGGDMEACDSRASCLLAPLCRKAEQAFHETLRSFTLAELRGAPLDLPNCLAPGTRAEGS